MNNDYKEKYDKNYFLELMQNKQVCFSKWRWTSVLLQQGSTRSCFRTTEGRFDPDNLGDFHNSPIQLETRQAMLDGKWPGHGCEYCKAIEESGGISDRMSFNAGSKESNIPPELFLDNKAVRVTPTLIEVSLNHTCNMSCVYCGPAYSSMWEAEEERNSSDRLRPREDLFDQETYQKVITQFYDWLDRNLKYLKDLHILGGEPTHQPELFKLIEILKTHPDTQLDTLCIFTNLKMSKRKMVLLCDTLNSLIEVGNIKDVTIMASLDCWGKSQEYLRTGLRLSETDYNLRYISENYPNIHLHVHGTITALTIPTIVDLVNKIIELNNIKTNNKITASWSLVEEYDYLHPRIMPIGFYDSWLDDLINIVDQHKLQYNLPSKFSSYKKYLNSIEPDFQKIQELILYLDKLDKRRNTNWRSTFPWFDDFVKQNVLLGKLK
jgi:organic radical activating enzyme